MEVRYAGISPSVLGSLFEFLQAIRYDAELQLSAHPFAIPLDHPLWRKVKEREFLESSLKTGSIDTSQWRVQNVAQSSTPKININYISFNVVNV